MWIVKWLIKWVLKTLLKLCVIILLIVCCAFFMPDGENEEKIRYSYSRETICKLKGNLSNYFEKLEESHLFNGRIWVDEENYNHISCNVELGNYCEIKINIYNYPDGREEISICYENKYSNFQKFADLIRNDKDHYLILQNIIQRLLSDVDEAPAAEAVACFPERIFDENELREIQEELDVCGDNEIWRTKYHESDNIYCCIYLHTGNFRKTGFEIDCNIIYTCNKATWQE